MNTLPANPPVEPPQQRQYSYWYGYVYGAFWTYVTYCGFMNLFGTLLLSGRQTSDTPGATAEFWISLILRAIATAAFGWAAYRLFMGKVTMWMIYILVVVHGVYIVMRGTPGALLLYIVLSYIAISCFKRQFKSVS
jgi:hypothetical protein